jgi:hypothetical protein
MDVDRVTHYRQMAAECLLVAQSANDPANKVLLLEMAQTWTRLAEEAAEDEAHITASELRGS